jgi:CRP-like cAMP-binding protein
MIPASRSESPRSSSPRGGKKSWTTSPEVRGPLFLVLRSTCVALAEVFYWHPETDTTQWEIPTEADAPVASTKTAAATAAARKKAEKRQVIMAESYDAAGADWRPPVYEKSVAAKATIKKAVTDAGFMFSSLSAAEIEQLVMAFKPYDQVKGDVIIKQGDKGDNFYIVESGDFDILVNDVKVASRGPGDFFGELALMYNAPRAASVIASTAAKVWGLDRITFRNMVASNREDQLSAISKGLHEVKLLSSLTDDQIDRIAEAVQLIDFKPGDVIIRKGEAGDKASTFYMVKSGRVICTDIGSGDKKLDDVELSAGAYFGERALLMDEPRAANVSAVDKTVCMTLNRRAFTNLLGPLQEVLDNNLSLRVLSSIPMFGRLTVAEKDRVVASFKTSRLAAGKVLATKGKPFDGFFVVKSGSVRSTDAGKSVERITPGGYFGQEALRASVNAPLDFSAADDGTEVFVMDKTTFEKAVGATLTTVQARSAAEVEEANRAASSATTASTGAGASASASSASGGSLVPVYQSKIRFSDLEIIRTLGAGTFGRVKLVRHRPTNAAYALKVLQKAQIVAYGQQKNVMNERNVMCMVNHPFVLKLCATFTDKDCLFMLLELVQGGELFSLLANQEAGYLPVDEARFYASCVISGLEALHAQDILYRDLKPENMLLDAQGYIKIVDMGFAKVVHDRTYTLCGTPEYLAPELVYGKGHGKGVDYWAVGVLIYEMLCGSSPFADESNDQMRICKKIVKGRYTFPTWMRDRDAKDIINKLLTQKVTSRLGCKRGGISDIKLHKWFRGVDWDALTAKRIAAPWVPPLKDPFDTSHFDPYEEDEEIEPYSDDGSGWDADF